MLKTEKTVLDQRKLRNRKIASVAAAFMLALPMFGCEPATETVFEPEEITQLDDHMDSKLVQGRDGCIEALTDAGKTKEEATKICDDMVEQAKAKNPPDFNASSGASGNYSGNNGNSNAMLWFLIGRNMSPMPYYGSPATGLSYFGSSSSSAPAKLSSTQTEYLRAPAGEARSSISSRLAAQPGARLAPVTRSFGSSRGSFSTSRGGFSTGRGVSMGG